MTNPLYSISLLHADAQAAVREFQDRYLAAMGAAQPSGFSAKYGQILPSDSGMVTFPVSQLRHKYQRSQGEGRARNYLHTAFTIKTEEFEDGYEDSLRNLQKNPWSAAMWAQQPGRLVLAEDTFRDAQCAALLEAGESTAWLTNTDTGATSGVNFFSASIPCNLWDTGAGTFSNYQSSTKDVVSLANIEAEVTAMKEVRDENGNRFGVRPDTILCPVEKEEALKNLLNQNFVPNTAGTATMNNPYFNGFNIVAVPEFTDVNDWYLVDSRFLAQFPLFIALRENVSPQLALRVDDESSELFRREGRLRVTSHIWYGFGLAFPHAIRKIKGA